MLPLVAARAATAIARPLMAKYLRGRLASTVARRALLSGSRAVSRRKKPIPFLLPIWDPEWEWPEPSPIPQPAFAEEGALGPYNMTGWTAAGPNCVSGGLNFAWDELHGNGLCTTGNSGNSLDAADVGGLNVLPPPVPITGGVRYWAYFTDTYENPHPSLGPPVVAKVTKPNAYRRDYLTANLTWTPPHTYDDLRPVVGQPRFIPVHVAGVIPPLYQTAGATIPPLLPMLQPVADFGPHPVAPGYFDIPKVRNPSPFPETTPETHIPGKVEPVPVSPSQYPVLHRSTVPATSAPPTGPHDRRPPRKNEREAKARVTVARAALRPVTNALGHVTEALDLLDVVFDAVPRHLLPRYKNTRFVKRHYTPQEKLRVIFDNWKSLNVPKVLIGHLRETLEDRMIATAARGVRRNQRAADPGNPFGWGTGPAL